MIGALKKKLAIYRKNRLVDSLAALSDEDAREVVRFARKGCHMAVNPPKGVTKKRREEGHGQDDNVGY